MKTDTSDCCSCTKPNGARTEVPSLEIESLCIHGNEKTYDHTGAISVPIFQSATFAHPAVGQSTGFDYSRLQNPTREALEQTVAKLENGLDALAFSTGMAAVTTLLELFSPGDHIIASSDLYGGTRRLFDHVSVKNGLTFTFVDAGKENAIKSSIQTNTKAIFLETPTNPMMQVADLYAAALLAREHDLLLIVDNTFLTPYFQRPLELGADVVLHSGTKYLGGHNDTLAGFLVVKDAKLLERLRFLYKTTGACLAPFDSWLILRGIKTLAVRMERQQSSALLIAEWLSHQPKVRRVHYAGLPDHPGYAISVRQARGFGGMLSFETDCEATALRILERVRVIAYAESLGGVESLITYPMLQTHADVPKEIREAIGIDERLLRLSVGLEAVSDLIADLSQAMED